MPTYNEPREKESSVKRPPLVKQPTLMRHILCNNNIQIVHAGSGLLTGALNIFVSNSKSLMNSAFFGDKQVRTRL